VSTDTGAVREPTDSLPLRRRHGRRVASAVVAVLAVAAVVGLATRVLDRHSERTGGVSDNQYPTSTTTVTHGSLSSQVSASGTLEYTASGGSGYSVVNQASGTFSNLPSAGETVSRGQVLYRVSNEPVVLLYGDTPIYRALYEGDSGPDVRELNRNLVALGYAARSALGLASDYFSAETAYALGRLQDHLGEDDTGSLSEGQAVFLPGQARISTVSATLGTNAGPGSPIAQATPTRRQVVLDLDASQQTEVKVDDITQITLPDNATTTGVVSGIGTVASSPGNGSGATLPIYITLNHPQAAGTLDQAPVQVQITTASVKNALIVPVDALLAFARGGYAVETVNTHRVHRLVAITLGTFDDADGTVQVAGALQAGQQIVVPGT
jgi:multidrug efflux pump subunit AcrA (membrane-fusion protein)